jgi:hypothetical protein
MLSLRRRPEARNDLSARIVAATVPPVKEA